MTIEIMPYVLPLAQEYRWAKGVQRERRGLLVRAEAFGAEGFGESAPPIHHDVDPQALAQEARALIAGLDANRDDFLAELDARGVPPRTRCGIAAAWMSARAAALVAQGYRTLKVKCWDDRASDLARVAAIREAAPHARLRLDANEAWDAAWSLQHVRALARHDIEYVEQPLPSARPLPEIAAFRRASPIPVALDESATDIESLARILAAGAADVIILKTQRAGGPDKAGAMIRAATDSGVRVTVTVSLESAIGTAGALHVAATLPAPLQDCGIAMGRFLARDLGPMPPVEAGAFMRVPWGGGLGIAPYAAAPCSQ